MASEIRKTQLRRAEVALAKEMCKLCGKPHDGPIIIGTHLKAAKPWEKTKMEQEVHGKVIGWAEKPCPECMKLMEQGVMVIVFDEHKSDTSRPIYEGWRTGHVCVMRSEAIERMPLRDDMKRDIVAKRYTFMSLEVAEHFGIIEAMREAPKG